MPRSYPDHATAINAALDELSRLAKQAKELSADREASGQLGAAERFELKAHVLGLCIKTIRHHLAAVAVAPAPQDPSEGQAAGELTLKTRDLSRRVPQVSPGRRRENDGEEQEGDADGR